MKPRQFDVLAAGIGERILVGIDEGYTRTDVVDLLNAALDFANAKVEFGGQRIECMLWPKLPGDPP